MSLLVLEDIYGGYGDVDILNGAGLHVDPGEIVVIIGPNGAGKSTAMKAVFGLVTIRKGRILFQGRDITRLAPDKTVRLGVCYVPQVANVFTSMTVRENLDMGAFIRSDDTSASLERVFELFPDLKTRQHQVVGTMSGGQRQMVAMGRALMVDPILLMLDEPTAGLSPLYIDQIFKIIQDINTRLGISILMVEQNAKKALGFASRGYVMTLGTNRYTDTGANLLANKDIGEMFLGG